MATSPAWTVTRQEDWPSPSREDDVRETDVCATVVPPLASLEETTRTSAAPPAQRTSSRTVAARADPGRARRRPSAERARRRRFMAGSDPAGRARAAGGRARRFGCPP
jgi:hypothetical protein